MARPLCHLRGIVWIVLLGLVAPLASAQPFPGQAPIRRPGIPAGVPPPGATTAGTTSAGNTTAGNARGFVPPGIGLVAGVRLDKPAQMPAGLNDIRGVAYDAHEQRLYLVGGQNPRLPQFRPEDLAVALKASDPGYPAVSIEGPIQDGRMTVHYYGGIEKTRFGQVLFEADRLLKSLALGRDNVTKKYLRPSVPGYESEVQKLRRMGGAQRPQAWHRYWFRPALVSMQVSEDGQALRFDQVKIEVRTEYVPPLAPGESEPAAEEFAQQFTDHFDDYAAIYPVFAELRELTKVTALAEWLKESGIPLSDSLGFDRATIPAVDTTTTTPIGYNEALALMPEGLWKHQMAGGVSLQLVKIGAGAGSGTAGASRDVPEGAVGDANWRIARGGSALDIVGSVLRKPSAEAQRWLSQYHASAPAPPGGATVTFH